MKSGKEGAWWPTELGDVVPEARERNLAKEILDSAHALGQRVLVYHRHMEDEAMLNAHPEWACLTSKGEQVDAGRGIHMCLNTPYADYFLKRMLELVDFGADGFYFDEEHMPPAGCWCPACKDGFAKLTGLEPPPNEDHTSPLWHKFVDYNNRVVEQAFLKWRAGLHAKRPDVVMLISSNSYPAMIERHLTQRLWRATDSVKTEFHVAARKGKYQFLDRNPQLFRPEPDVRIGFAFDLSRDAADGRPPHIWTHGVPDEKSLLFATGGLLTHGAIANLDMNEKTIPNPSFKSSFDLGRKVSPFLAGTRPASWALIHYSELARDVYATDEAAWWAREMLPVLGAYEALLHARRPAGVLTDSQFEEGRFGGAKVLFLPAPEHLTEPMRKQADAFRARGGLVVENRPEWRWAEPQGAAPAREAFLKFLDAAPPCPVHATGGHPRLHLGAFENPERTRMSVLLANPFTWIFTGAAEKGEEETKARLDQAPAPGKGVIVTLAGRRPLKVTEILSGNELEIQSAAGGAWKVEAPEFEFLSFLSVEFEAAKP
ncbi:MAG: hypothetical protein M5U26_28145 [Planctomycetota bacterium]|nr:hypothetical protein [Planctomycetota bacterium]